MVRRDDQAYPLGVGTCARIAVDVARPDGGHRPPEVVVILRVPARDQRVGRGRREHRKVAGVLCGPQEIPDRQRAPRADPLERRVVAPEAPDVGLLCGPDARDRPSECLDLVVVARPQPAAEIRRRARAGTARPTAARTAARAASPATAPRGTQEALARRRPGPEPGTYVTVPSRPS